VGVFELLTLNSELRRLVNARATEEEILDAARANGLSTLREQAIELVRQGVTTIDEITRVFHEL
jgi:type II secretory ATPase GspE/PulE/Tfp pilus assembly ATPase PilB-like protein